MSYPGTSHAAGADCRDCGATVAPARLTAGRCPDCDAEAYRRNQR